MPTRDEVEAAVAYRAAQTRLRAGFLRDSLALWPLLDKKRVGATSPDWLRAQIRLVRQWRQLSATSAARYYRLHNHRASVPTVELPEKTIVRNLLHAGPGEIDRAIQRGLSETQADAAARVSASQSGARLVLGGGRDAIDAAVKADPLALGWMRVADDHPCGFCGMLASRGPVYKTAASAGARDARDVNDPDAPVSRYHDGCACQVVPIFSRDFVVPESTKRLRQLWADSTAGLSGAEARRAFRRAVENRS